MLKWSCDDQVIFRECANEAETALRSHYNDRQDDEPAN